MSKVVGSWTCVSKENAEGLLEAFGLKEDSPHYKAMLECKPHATITQIDEDEFECKVESAVHNHSYKFTLGKEFDEETALGHKLKSVVTKEGEHTFKKVSKCEASGCECTTVFEAVDEHTLTQTTHVKDVTAKATYKRD